MATVALLDLWKKKASKLKKGFQAYKRGLITHSELDYFVMRDGCLPVDWGQIPWDHVQHLVITNPKPSFHENNHDMPDIFPAYNVFFDEDENLLYIAWPKPSKISELILQRSHTLESLRLYNLDLQVLPSLSALNQLHSLEISKCNNLIELGDLTNLKQLTYLTISRCENLSKIDGLSSLKQLRHMNLSGCKHIAQLNGLESLTQLTTLKLSNCANLTVLPDGIRCMKALRMLDLMSMQLTGLPDWLPEIAESFTIDYNWSNGIDKAIVSLHDTTVEGVDMSIFEQPYEMVVEWFEKRKQGQTHPLNEIKVVFLGDGEAGKSYTIARLMNDGDKPDPLIFDGQSTPGIVIRNKEYDLEGRKIQVHYWDFGGQEIMHSMHRIFLTGRTMYVVLLNARDDTQGDRAKYWLHNVKSFAPDAPVLLVLNKIDQNENASVDEVDLRGRYEKLTQIVRLSALKYSQEEFTAKFTDILLEEIQKTGYLDAQWPTVWTRVKEKLENMETHYITGSDYRAICRECMVDDNQKNLLHWFNDLGVSFCCDGEDDYALEDYVILRPDWITNALYIILFNKLEGARNGLIPHRTIYNLLRNAHGNPAIRCTLPQARYSLGDIGYVLGVMRKFNLSFPHGTDHEFIPMLCQQNSTVDVQYYHRDENTLEFNMEFDYLPNNLLHRLMVERHAELDMDNVWRTGARFELRELGLSAVVVIDGNTLRFFIRNTDPMHKSNIYLAMLKANVDRIWSAMGLKEPICQVVHKKDGRQDVFDYAVMKAMVEAGQSQIFSMAWRQMLPISDILNQSAPERLTDEKKLLEKILVSCQHLQGESDYQISTDAERNNGLEDKRNRRIRDDLEIWGYTVKDQPQYGRSGTGKSIGELDILVYSEDRKPWTVIEALRLSKYETGDWNHHLDKLLYNYNYFGAHSQYLLTYVDCRKEEFGGIWTAFKAHIQGQSGGGFPYVEGSFVDLNDSRDPLFVKKSLCRYNCGGLEITVYHIFAQIDLP